MPRPSLLARALVGYGVHLPDHPRKWWVHEKLRTALKARVAGEHVVSRCGLQWSLTPSDYCQSSLYWLGIKDQWELLILERLLSDDAIVLDVGANFGYYSVRIAHFLNEQGRVYAIEPNPTNFARIERNAALNRLGDKLKTRCVGVSDEPGTLKMSDDAINMGHAIVCDSPDSYPISVTTIDRLCEEEGLEKVDAIILDVEGYEPRALRGAASVIERFKPLIMVELWQPVMARQGSTVGEIASVLEGFGYKLFEPVRDRLVPLRNLPEGDRGVNVFAFHQEKIPTSLVERSA